MRSELEKYLLNSVSARDNAHLDKENIYIPRLHGEHIIEGWGRRDLKKR